ncbi:hypothetical protein ANTQUA_LOCUS2953 [Anthophora quadrimaculata]
MATDEARLKFLIRKRSGIKSHMTIFEKYLTGYEQQPDPVMLKYKFQRLKEIYSTFEDVQAEIEVLQEEGDHETERFEAEERYIEACVKTDKWLTQPAVNNSVATIDCATPTPSSSGLQVNLPKVDLPNFSGKFEDWLSFKDKFISMIDSQDGFSKVQKFHYLGSALSGEAARVIAAMETTENNYSTAWQLLQDTYANETLIIARHTDLLVQTPPVEQETAPGLRDFVSHVLQHLRSLTTLGVPVKHWDHLLMSILLPKLARQTRMSFDGTLKDKESPTIDGLIEFLRQRARRLETTSPRRTNGQSNGSSPRASPTRQRKQTGKLPKTTSRKNPKVFATSTLSKNCVLCKDKTHTIHRCERFHALSASERLNTARKEKLCVKCLRSGHSARECTSSQCKICNLAHNTLLHLPRNTRRSSTRRSPTPPKAHGSTTAAESMSGT